MYQHGGEIAVRCFDLEGLCRSQKTVLFSFIYDEDPRGQNVSQQFTPLAT